MAEQETDNQNENEVDQDAMAAEWAAMAEGGGDDAPGDASAGGSDGGAGDQDAMAAEWAAIADGDGDSLPGDDMAAAGGQPTRVLNQDEIDSLLGFDDNAGDGDGRRGISALFNNTMVSYERLPMLEVVFDRVVRLLTTSLRNFTSDNVEVSIDGMVSVRFGDYLNSIPLPAMLAVFKAEEWDDYGLITIDSALIYSVVDVLLGGGRLSAPIRIEGRPYTTIERNLVERMIHACLSG